MSREDKGCCCLNLQPRHLERKGVAVISISNPNIWRGSRLPLSSFATLTSREEAGCHCLHLHPQHPERKWVAIIFICNPDVWRGNWIAVNFINNLDVQRGSRLLLSSLATSMSREKVGCRHLHLQPQHLERKRVALIFISNPDVWRESGLLLSSTCFLSRCWVAK